MDRVRSPHLLKRVERARRVVSHCSQAAIRAYDEEALLSEASRHLIDEGGYCMAWFAEAKAGPGKLTTLAHAGTNPSGVRGDQMPWTVELGSRMPTMRALLEQRPHVVRGIVDDPALKLRYPDAEALGYSALCAFPIQFGPHGAGVLSIYAREPDAFAPEEVALLRELAGDMAVGVSALRARKANDVLEERLELAERRFRSIVEHAPIGIVQLAGDGQLILANRAMADLLGYESAEALASVGPSILAQHLEPADLQRLCSGVANGGLEEPLQFELKRRDGTTFWAEVRAKPANGGNAGIEAVVRDLTAERAAQAAQVVQERQRLEVVRLEELDRMRSEFMGRASHELNTPLTPILLQVQALQAPGLEPRMSRGLELIERNVLRLASLVKDLLAASKLQAHEVPLQPSRIDLDEMAAQVVESFRQQAQGAGIRLTHPSKGPVPAFADGSHLVQVLFNLVSNALKFTPRGGSVTVRCRLERDGSGVCTVVDTGRGFPQELAGKMFEPFGRLHEHLPADPGGTGLGLFISKAIVDQSGGTLWARSAGPGKGAVFGFMVPAKEGLEEQEGLDVKEDLGEKEDLRETPVPQEPGRGIVAATGFSGTPADAEPGEAKVSAEAAGSATPPAESQAERTRSR